MDTVDHLIELLVQRKEELEITAQIESAQEDTPIPPTEEILEDDEVSHFQFKPKRSRSYEALVQMEAILEARHQQLMQHGTLEAYDTKRTTSPNRMDDIQDEIARMHMQMLPPTS
ncbi:hypothetical protein THRCLA_23348 [Thraustotheca clavata]|uniref:Uncharacterized protein n=1 Tax=Thraustotheca clavata TaxID=74557 RepID=A0A1V9Y785_9STRA|nr:hypothetical protein THRCLA_23348 [Thraustotheca clavata]